MAKFAGTTAAGPPGVSTPTPVTEDDFEWDVGVVHRLTPRVTLSQDNLLEITRHYLDTGQFGVVPIFAPFNYDQGFIWGSETAVYKGGNFSAYGNVTIGRNLQRGVVTGQFKFPADEFAVIEPAGPGQFDPAGGRDWDPSIGLWSAANCVEHADHSVLNIQKWHCLDRRVPVSRAC